MSTIETVKNLDKLDGKSTKETLEFKKFGINDILEFKIMKNLI
jgi:hypothetical protein